MHGGKPGDNFSRSPNCAINVSRYGFATKETAMKFVLRNNSTGRYVKSAGLWATQPDDAMTFEDMTEVREYCQAHRLENVQPIRRLMPYLVSLLRGKNDAKASR